jgi:uncharacterized protein
MINLDVKRAFQKHVNKMEILNEDEQGVLKGGFSNFPKTAYPKIEDEAWVSSPFATYKLSRFNNFVPYEERIIGFNSMTQRFLVLDPVLLDLINAAMLEDQIEGLKELHPSLFAEMKTLGFLVDSNLDETELVKEMQQEIDHTDSQYVLVINPTMNCNFKCWYCYESHIKGSKMNGHTLEKIKQFIANKMETQQGLKSFHISWFGGEPMLYFEDVIRPIVEFAAQKAEAHGISFHSGMTTNGYLFKPHMFPFFKEHNLTHFQITLDGNKDKHNTIRYTANKKGSYDKIVENIKLLAQHDLIVDVRINYTPETLEKIEELIDEFAEVSEAVKANMNFSFHKVWQDKSMPNQQLLDSIINNFRNNEMDTSSMISTSDTLRQSCYADKKNQATINYNGEIFKCTARDFNASNQEGSLTEQGEIIWNERYEKRMDAKFKNPSCLTCPIQPICNGGCSQVAMENEGKDYCVVEDAGHTKSEVVLSRFLHKVETLLFLRSRIVKKLNAVN